jgi:hypothetical protein
LKRYREAGVLVATPTDWSRAMPVSPVRLADVVRAALTFDEYVATAGETTQFYVDTYAAAALDVKDSELLAAVPPRTQVFAVVEDGCSDVIASLPIVARLVDDTDALTLHVLVRDESIADIAAAYPAPDGRSRIPTFILADADFAPLGAVVERTSLVHQWVEQFLSRFLDQHGVSAVSDLERDVLPQLFEFHLRGRCALLAEERRSLVESFVDIVTAAGVPVQ